MENLCGIFGFTDVEWIGSELGIAPPGALSETKKARRSPSGVIAFPGLINSHDHLQFNCYPPTGCPPYRDFVEWSRDVQAMRDRIEMMEAIPLMARSQLGLLKNLLWGVTAVADHGGKTIFDQEAVEVLPTYRTLHSPEFEPWARAKLMTGFGPVVMHIAEGTTAESRQRARAFLGGNLLRRPIAGVHGVSFEDDDFARLNALIWCPASNLYLFGRTADVEVAAQYTAILFGTDATLSAPGTLWDHLRQARGRLPDLDVFASLTSQAARFWRLPASHWHENFVIARRKMTSKWDAFFSLTPDDILMVVRAGRVVLLDGSLAAAYPLSAELSPIIWGDSRKYVRLPVQAMFAALGRSAPRFDQAALIDRFAGAATGGRRAA